ncbi:unnamed protein product [Amoebophrya sp. A120]|nr:unnamed protein product [Amoebophrya sp. A120]|eukprot:GSA120T00000140001.1
MKSFFEETFRFAKSIVAKALQSMVNLVWNLFFKKQDFVAEKIVAELRRGEEEDSPHAATSTSSRQLDSRTPSTAATAKGTGQESEGGQEQQVARNSDSAKLAANLEHLKDTKELEELDDFLDARSTTSSGEDGFTPGRAGDRAAVSTSSAFLERKDRKSESIVYPQDFFERWTTSPSSYLRLVMLAKADAEDIVRAGGKGDNSKPPANNASTRRKADESSKKSSRSRRAPGGKKGNTSNSAATTSRNKKSKKPSAAESSKGSSSSSTRNRSSKASTTSRRNTSSSSKAQPDDAGSAGGSKNTGKTASRSSKSGRRSAGSSSTSTRAGSSKSSQRSRKGDKEDETAPKTTSKPVSTTSASRPTAKAIVVRDEDAGARNVSPADSSEGAKGDTRPSISDRSDTTGAESGSASSKQNKEHSKEQPEVEQSTSTLRKNQLPALPVSQDRASGTIKSSMKNNTTTTGTSADDTTTPPIPSHNSTFSNYLAALHQFNIYSKLKTAISELSPNSLTGTVRFLIVQTFRAGLIALVCDFLALILSAAVATSGLSGPILGVTFSILIPGVVTILLQNPVLLEKVETFLQNAFDDSVQLFYDLGRNFVDMVRASMESLWKNVVRNVQEVLERFGGGGKVTSRARWDFSTGTLSTTGRGEVGERGNDGTSNSSFVERVEEGTQ